MARAHGQPSPLKSRPVGTMAEKSNENCHIDATQEFKTPHVRSYVPGILKQEPQLEGNFDIVDRGRCTAIRYGTVVKRSSLELCPHSSRPHACMSYRDRLRAQAKKSRKSGNVGLKVLRCLICIKIRRYSVTICEF